MNAFEAIGYSGYIRVSIDGKAFNIPFSFECKVDLHLENEVDRKGNIASNSSSFPDISTDDFVLDAIAKTEPESDFEDVAYGGDDDDVENVVSSLVCDTCGSTCENFDALKKHCADHLRLKTDPKMSHKNMSFIPYDLVCPYCKVSFNSSYEYNAHRQSQSETQVCLSCRKCFDSLAHYTIHNSLEHGIGTFKQPAKTNESTDPNGGENSAKKTVICPICGESFKENYLLKHVTFKHTLEGVFTCCVCKKTFRNIKGWNDHCETHLHGSFKPSGSTKCSQCGLVFKTRGEFIEHSQSAHKSKSKCLFCGDEFLFYSLLKQHYAQVHADSMHKCEVCGVLFAKKSNLKSHMNQRHNAKHSGQCPTCGNFVCNLKQHIRDTHPTETALYTCPDCPKTFSTLSRLKKHLPMHSKTGFECQFCKKVLKTMNSLREHLQMHGYNKKEYECSICKKVMSRRDNLKAHMKTHKVPPRTHVCKICHKNFAYMKELRTHMALHEFETG